MVPLGAALWPYRALQEGCLFQLLEWRLGSGAPSVDNEALTVCEVRQGR